MGGFLMINQNMEKMLNDQIQKEIYSAYLYLSMEAYLASISLDGFANFFHIQAREEMDHAMKIFNYINQVGGRVVLEQIDQPQIDFESPSNVFKLAFEHEQFVTRSIHSIVNAALEEKDHSTNTFLQWFVTEQAEEEESMDKYVQKLKLVGDQGPGLFMIDNELAQRVYVPPVAN